MIVNFNGALASALAVVCLAAVGCAETDRASADLEAARGATVEYIGHAAFRVTSSDGSRVVIDPYGSRIWIGYDFPESLETDAVLITHPHYDHDGGTSRGRTFPWPDAMPVHREPGTYAVGDMTLIGIQGKHADPYGKEFGQINTLWLIDVGGLRIAHIGDNGPLTEGNIRALGRVDMLMMPIDAQYHILKEHEIQAIVASLAPRWLVPMHYRIPELEPNPGEPDDLGDLEPWLNGKENIRRVGAHRAVFSPEDRPESMEIVVFEHSPDIPVPTSEPGAVIDG